MEGHQIQIHTNLFPVRQTHIKLGPAEQKDEYYCAVEKENTANDGV